MHRPALLVIATCALFGMWQVAHATTARHQTAVIDSIVKIEAQAENGGTHGYRIRARFVLGNNACEAQGVMVGFVRHTADRGRTLELIPTRVLPRGLSRLCGSEWHPVYRTLETYVRAGTTRYDEVDLLNVGQAGTRTSVRELLMSDVTVTVKGVLTTLVSTLGEATSSAIEMSSGETIELDVHTGGFARRFQSLLGSEVTLHGLYKTVTGPELSRQVLEVTSLEPSR